MGSYHLVASLLLEEVNPLIKRVSTSPATSGLSVVGHTCGRRRCSASAGGGGVVGECSIRHDDSDQFRGRCYAVCYSFGRGVIMVYEKD